MILGGPAPAPSKVLRMHNQAPVSVVGKGQLGEAPGGLVIGGAITPGQGGARLLAAMILTYFDLAIEN